MKKQLEDVYQGYPRKIGKTAGIKRLEKEVLTEEDVTRLRLALSNYKRYLKDSEITESKYIKHFSTWTSSWTDWLDYEHDEIASDPFILLRGGKLDPS